MFSIFHLRIFFFDLSFTDCGVSTPSIFVYSGGQPKAGVDVSPPLLKGQETKVSVRSPPFKNSFSL